MSYYSKLTNSLIKCRLGRNVFCELFATFSGGFFSREPVKLQATANQLCYFEYIFKGLLESRLPETAIKKSIGYLHTLHCTYCTGCYVWNYICTCFLIDAVVGRLWGELPKQHQELLKCTCRKKCLIGRPPLWNPPLVPSDRVLPISLYVCITRARIPHSRNACARVCPRRAECIGSYCSLPYAILGGARKHSGTSFA